jgi:hypothetical protein
MWSHALTSPGLFVANSILDTLEWDDLYIVGFDIDQRIVLRRRRRKTLLKREVRKVFAGHE